MPRDDFLRQPHSRAQGRLGEDAAAEWLERRGYRVVERNFASRVGEIDVVAAEGDTLCFIEIKARSTDTYGSAVEALSASQQRRIARAASLYLARKPHRGPCRFDLLAMDLGAGGWRYTLVRDAFMAPA